MDSTQRQLLLSAKVSRHQRKAYIENNKQYLGALAEIFRHYFPETEDRSKGNIWINIPFSKKANSRPVDLDDKEKLIEYLLM
ncbi:hypothetical protein NPIL_338671 [Nephila pilipes]|uniref:Uncharacterized protein n=1 Tax=Nephila pilipes TaxID=299642 RepID=A0A8X6NJ21_NEPPI|nr:hypothetical protein NPIL_338671 [Nephila pilipes]